MDATIFCGRGYVMDDDRVCFVDRFCNMNIFLEFINNVFVGELFWF